jgi:hypothetical protein
MLGALLLIGCSDRSPVSVGPATSLRDAVALPMPANAVTVTLDSFPQFPDYDPSSLVHRSFTTPTITAYSFYNVYQYFGFGPGHNALVSTSSGLPVQITFGKPVSRVRLVGNSPSGFEMECPTRTREVLSGRIEGYGNIINGDEWRQLSTIDLSGPGILYCTFNGRTVIESITIVPEPQTAKLVLMCRPGASVQRGDSISCTAGTSPTGAIRTNLIWMFTDSAGHRIPGPTGSDTTWGGVMAVGGMMKVEGAVGGVATADSVAIRATGRTWSHLRLDVKEKGHGDLPAPAAIRRIGELAHTHVDEPSNVPAHLITEGPNKGWVVMDSIPEVPVTVHISDAWHPGNVWYNLQHWGVYHDPQTGAPFGHYCDKSELPAILRDARGHEGSIPWDGTSHVDIFQVWVNHHPTAQNDVEAAVAYEPDLSSRGMTVGDWFSSIWLQYVRRPLITDPDQRHTNDVPPGKVDVVLLPCALRF